MCKRVERICQVDPAGWYAPVIGQELVRCKDCKCYDVAKNETENSWCNWLAIVTDDYSYCAWAERKEE